MRELWVFEWWAPVEPFPEILWHRLADARTTVCGWDLGDPEDTTVFEMPDAGEMICPACQGGFPFARLLDKYRLPYVPGAYSGTPRP